MVCAGLEYNDYRWTNERIIQALQTIYNKHGHFPKCQLAKKFSIEGEICRPKLIRERFGNLENAAALAGIKFSQPYFSKGIPRKGHNEKTILDSLENMNNIEILRQVRVDKYYVDGYDKLSNTVYEVYEPSHKRRVVEDSIREDIIKKELNCNFIVIRDGW